MYVHYSVYVSKRADVSQINALMNRDDAEFNQQSVEYQILGMKSQLKDAQANKTISIVTMTFLPATAVAAICSMGVFNWQQPDRVHVSRHFWIFWVVAITLTALALGIFLIWKRRLHTRARQLKRDKEEEKSKKDGDSDEDSNIPDEPKYGASKRQQDSKTKGNKFDLLPKRSNPRFIKMIHEEQNGQVRSSRRRSRHRSHIRRSRTTSRDGIARPDFGRTASRLSFRGESEIV